MLENNYKEKLIDFHTHMDNRVSDEERVVMLCNVSSKEEYQMFMRWKNKRNQDLYSIGVHPWNADTIYLEELKPYMKQAVCIGEIGMDHVWCNVELQIQEKVFREQLHYAMELGKSVILHTKGMEKEIVEIIKEYPNIYILHWFDELKYLKDYQELDCYFTIGPAILIQKELKTILQRVSIERILVESDGIKALEWLYNQTLTREEYYRLLKKTYLFLSDFYQLSFVEFQQQIQKNKDRILYR